MKKLILSVMFCGITQMVLAQVPDSVYVKQNYEKVEVQIPMRDGIKLFTTIYSPKDTKLTPY